MSDEEKGPKLEKKLGGITILTLAVPLSEDSKRTQVDIRPVRVRDVRNFQALLTDSDNVNVLEALVQYASEFTNLDKNEIDLLAIEDLAAIKGVVESQMEKLVRSG